MNPNDLLSNALARSDHILWLWCFHAAASVALVVAVAGVPPLRADRRLFRLLLGGYVLYAYTHLECMRWQLKQWGAVAGVFMEQDAYQKGSDRVRHDLGGVVAAPHPLWVIPFHLAFDAFAVYAIWTAGRPRPPA